MYILINAPSCPDSFRLRITPFFPIIYTSVTLYIVAYWSLNQYALESCEVKHRDEILKAAHQYAINGQFDDAISEYLKILPSSVGGKIQNILGDLYLKKDSKTEAIKYFREAAVIANKEESHAKAIALYHKILFINPDQLDVVIELAEINAERGFIRQAVDGLRRAAEVYYSDGLPLKAISILKQALSICPADIELKIKIAELQLTRNQTDNAIHMYLSIAHEYEEHAETVKAENMYKKVISLDPENMEAFIRLSRLAEDNQDLERSMEYMSKAVALAPDDSDLMSDYVILASKANIDISQHVSHAHDGPDHNGPEYSDIPHTVQHVNESDYMHEPLDLSPDSTQTGNQYKAASASVEPSSVPFPSADSFSENNDITGPPYTGGTGAEKNGIWEDNLHEDTNSLPVTDAIRESTAKQVTGHEDAEAEYEQKGGASAFNLSETVPVHEKTEKDAFRLKRRIKKNGLHAAFALFIVMVTGLSFFVTFQYLHKRQIVEIESVKNLFPTVPLPEKEFTAREDTSVTDKTYNQDVPDVQPDKKIESISIEGNITKNTREVLTLPVRDTQPVVQEEALSTENIHELPLYERELNPVEPDEEVIKPILANNADTHGKEEPHSNNENFQVLNMESETVVSEIIIIPDNRIEKAHNEENDDVNNSDTIISTVNPEEERDQKKEMSHVERELRNVIETTNEMKREPDQKIKDTAFISFIELFDNNDNNWEIATTEAAHVRLEHGKYYIQNRRKSGAYIILNGPDISTNLDFEIESHLHSIAASDGHPYGLIFGAKNKEDFFVFQVLPGNNYSIRKYFRGVSLELAGGHINSRPDSQDLNHVLKIKSKENKLSFYMDGNVINDVPDIYFSNRKTGFFIDINSGIVIDKLIVHYQPG